MELWWGKLENVAAGSNSVCVALEWDEGKDEDVGEDIGERWIGSNETIAGT